MGRFIHEYTATPTGLFLTTPETSVDYHTLQITSEFGKNRKFSLNFNYLHFAQVSMIQCVYSPRNTASVRVTTNLLGQAFSLLMRLVVELLQTLPAEGPHPPFVLPTLPADEERIHEELWTVLKPVWEWLSTVMDSTEAQLRLGCSLSGGGLTENVTGKATNVSSSSSGRSSDTTSSESKRGFLSYLLSVMRCESNEHAGKDNRKEVVRENYCRLACRLSSSIGYWSYGACSICVGRSCFTS